MASKAEAKQLTGELLGIVPIGQALQAHHDTRISESYDEVYAELRSLSIPVWDTSEEMPDEITPHFVRLMALNKSDLFGISDARLQRIIINAGQDGVNSKAFIKQYMNNAAIVNDEETDY